MYGSLSLGTLIYSNKQLLELLAKRFSSRSVASQYWSFFWGASLDPQLNVCSNSAMNNRLAESLDAT
jgi:hypothetical protein